jgi:hypothetical protein
MAAAKSNPIIAALKTGAKVVGTTGFLSVGFAFVGIGGAINYYASASQGGLWPWAAIGSTVLTAALLKAALLLFMRRRYIGCFLAVALAVPFFAQNWVTASGNVASVDKQTEDARADHKTDAGNREDRRKDAVDRRDEAKKAAAGETEGSTLDKIEQIKAKRPAARNCDNAPTRQACADIAALKVKSKAAKAYEKAVAEIAGIDAESRGAGVTAAQSTSVGAGATIKALSIQLGYDMTDKEGERFFEHQRGGCLELAAAIAPAVAWLLAWLLFWAEDDKEAEAPKPRASVSVSPKKRLLPRLPRLASFLSGIIATPAKAEPVVSFPIGSGREFDRRYFEETGNPKDKIPAGAIQKRYAEDCARHGVEARGEKALSQELQEFRQYGKTKGGRPYYYGIKWRAVPLPLAIQQGPRVVVDNTLGTVSAAAAARG